MSRQLDTFIFWASSLASVIVFIFCAYVLYLALRERRRVDRINAHYHNWAMTTSDSQYWVLRRNTERQLNK
ncbi:hypothetical protein [Vibrio parahaemolyticus]|uniref:hypothetical protein n=1 Tax=Vibrio parahaemolyticus TaxID=670 RepID=UPI00128FAA25|nr:hypothetical protein [Vibrio parahaemolyticus]MCX8905253.1 hypothetical protein [Vibrio parahaemolyticus]MQF45474.1 hypothetical protein [Vibrio parahaemolyticus]